MLFKTWECLPYAANPVNLPSCFNGVNSSKAVTNAYKVDIFAYFNESNKSSSLIPSFFEQEKTPPNHCSFNIPPSHVKQIHSSNPLP